MSGGSMNYVYSRLESDANFRLDTPERRAFRKHLDLVIQALHDIEWVDSCDYGRGDETKAIRACLSKEAIVEALVEDAKAAQTQLADELRKLGEGREKER